MAGVKVATAILIKGELWSFFAPANVSVDAVRGATAKVLPYYVVLARFVKVDDFPKTA